mmetsp:Transcript_12510/g.45618  ORF Transcript_12510/g.45618 Transcript_12510/m.45618 type:complete len:794 (+) Transcript_12510:306-2687(+)
MRNRPSASRRGKDFVADADATGGGAPKPSSKRRGKGKRGSKGKRKTGRAHGKASGNESDDAWDGIGVDTEGAALYAKAVAAQWQTLAESQTISSVYAAAYANMKPKSHACLYVGRLLSCVALLLLTCALFAGPRASLQPMRASLHQLVNTHREYVHLAQLADATLRNLNVSELYIVKPDEADSGLNDDTEDDSDEQEYAVAVANGTAASAAGHRKGRSKSGRKEVAGERRRQVQTTAWDFVHFLVRRMVLRDAKYTPNFGLMVNQTFVNDQLLTTAQLQLERELALEEARHRDELEAARRGGQSFSKGAQGEEATFDPSRPLLGQLPGLIRHSDKAAYYPDARRHAEQASSAAAAAAQKLRDAASLGASGDEGGGGGGAAGSQERPQELPQQKKRPSTPPVPKKIYAYGIQLIPDAYNPMLGNATAGVRLTSLASALTKDGQLRHHTCFNRFGQFTGTAETEHIIDWLGVKTLFEYDCTHQGGSRRFLASRRVSCAKHERLLQQIDEEERERLATGGLAASRKATLPDIEGELPVIDQDYMQYIFLLASVLASDPDDRYVVADMGARFGMWGVRALAAYRAKFKRESFTLVAAEPHTDRLVNKHARENGLHKSVDLLNTAVRTTTDLLDVLERAPMFDLLMLNNLEGYEAAVLGLTAADGSGGDNDDSAATTGTDNAGDGGAEAGERALLPTTTEVMQTLENRVKRLFVRVANAASYQAIKELLQSKGWHKVVDLPRTANIKQCDKTVSAVEAPFDVHLSCTTDTAWGPVYVREGMLGFVNPAYVGDEDAPLQ